MKEFFFLSNCAYLGLLQPLAKFQFEESLVFIYLDFDTTPQSYFKTRDGVSL